MERCSLSIWHGFDNRIQHVEDISLADAIKLKEEYRKEAILYSGKHPRPDNVLYCVIEHDDKKQNSNCCKNCKTGSITRRLSLLGPEAGACESPY